MSELFPSVPNPGILNKTAGLSTGGLITGNTLGGSSAINGMQWVIPTTGSVEKWGIKGLTTETSKMFYRRAFRTVGFAPQGEDLRIRYVREHINASAAAGFPENLDPFDTSVRRDMFENRLAIDPKGFRRDSCTAYLTPVLNARCKHNLRLIQSWTVTKIILMGRNAPRAVGVECASSRAKNSPRRLKIFAKREVLLAAGPFGSPKLLLLSGIGPPDVLRKAGIPTRVSLDVGSTTQARSFVAIASRYSGVPLEPSNNSTLLNSASSRAQWESGRGGVLGTASFMTNGRDRRDAYLTGAGSFFPENLDKPRITTNCNGNADSIGYIRVKSSDPFAFPEVQTSLLTEKEDIDRLERCLNRIVKIHENFPTNFQLSFVYPTGGRVNRTWIRSRAGWSGHFVGGCPVGPVLRSDLSVRKVKSLRVIDASCFERSQLPQDPWHPCT